MAEKDCVRRIIETGLKPPETLTLMITSGCNQHCRHCLLDCQSFKTITPVPREALLRLIAEFSSLGGTRLTLTGGEALTHPHWFEILDSACSRFNFKQVCLQTNATLLRPAIATVLASLPVDRFVVQISLDGATAKTHDYVRGTGSFESTLKGLRLLSGYGFSNQIRVAFTEMRHNFQELSQLLELVDSLGIGSMVSNTLIKGGRAGQTDLLAPPVPEQYQRLLDLYHNDRQFKGLYTKYATIAAIEWFEGQFTPSTGNCTCVENLFIDADGDLHPCVMLLDEQYAIKNAHSHSLEVLIEEALDLWGELPLINRRRHSGLEACIGCPGHEHCAGGCMGRAYAVYGDFMREEDRCSLRKTVYSSKGPS